jgi:hypothetical protein
LASYLAGLRITKRNISATILADVKRFFHQINTDEVFGTHRCAPSLMVSALDVLGAQEALAPIESPATASQMTLTCTFIPRSSSGLPA